MSERRFVICEAWDDGLGIPKVTEAELKRRLALAYRAFSRSEDVEPRYTLDEAIDILLYGTKKQEPVFGDHLSPERMEEVEADRAKRRAAPQATEQEWRVWAGSVAHGIISERFGSYEAQEEAITERLLAIPCNKRREG